VHDILICLQQKEAKTKQVGELRNRVAELLAQLSRKIEAKRNDHFPCDLRLHGRSYVDCKNIKTVFHKMCFSLNLTPPPKIIVVFRLRQHKHSCRPGHKKLENMREKIRLEKTILIRPNIYSCNT